MLDPVDVKSQQEAIYEAGRLGGYCEAMRIFGEVIEAAVSYRKAMIIRHAFVGHKGEPAYGALCDREEAALRRLQAVDVPQPMFPEEPGS